MKKVLMVATYGDFFAAFETHNIKILNDMGCEVHLCANWTDKRYNYKHDKLEGLEFKKINIEFERSPFSKVNLTRYKELSLLMKKGNYYLVDCHNAVIGVYARLAAKKNKVPKVMYTAHGFQFYKGGSKKDWLIYYPIEKFLSRYTDMLVVMNSEDFEYANSFNTGQVELIPGVGVDTKYFHKTNFDVPELKKSMNITENSFVLVSIGELSERKNHKVVIKALSDMKNLDITYLIVGSGENEFELKEMVNSLDLNNRVKFLGYRSDVNKILKVSDLAVFPSYREGLMVAGIEALSSGLPILSSNRKGIRDYTEEDINGYLFDPDDDKQLANLIFKLKNNRSKLNELSDNAIVSSKKYSTDTVNLIMKRIYEEVLK